MRHFPYNQVAVEAIGPKVSHSADHPVYIDQMNVRFPSIVEKSIIIMEHLYTASNNSSSKDESRIQIQFQAILLNLDDDQNSLKSGEEYYISAGAEFGELLLVCQAQISTVLIPNVRFISSMFYELLTLLQYVGLRTQHCALHHPRAREN